LTDITEVTRARHLALLAFNMMFDDNDGQNRHVAEKAAAAAVAVDDLEATVIAKLTLVCFDCADGYVTRGLATLEELSALSQTDDLAAASLLVTNYYANALALVGRIEDADEQIAAGVARARREGDTMALDAWTVIQAAVDLAAGRVSSARAAAESLPPPKSTGATEIDMVRMVVLVGVAIATDDRTLLQHMVADANTAYLSGTAMVRRLAAHALTLAAWYREDLHDAVRWFGGDIDPLSTAIMPLSLNHVILAARVASAAGDAGCHARALRAAEKLQREQPANPMFTAVAIYVRGILEHDAHALMAAADLFASSARPLFYAAAAEDAGAELARIGRTEDAVAYLTAAFDTYLDHEATAHARRVGRELRQLGVERRIVSQPRAKTGWDSLTVAELKVVNLIARGATNRDVAESLHLSLHTVKTHAHNAFTKLGINSRTQLGPLMRG
jgi:DNA-binding CsgD family transcriptional regulator